MHHSGEGTLVDSLPLKTICCSCTCNDDVCAQVHLCHAAGHVRSGEGELQRGIQVTGDGHVAA